MTFKSKLQNDLKEALKAKEAAKVSTLKMLFSAIVNKEIELRKKESGLSDEESLSVVKSEIKKRRDAIEAYEKGGRADLASREKEEMEILNPYLPEQMSDAAIEEAVRGIIKALDAGPGDFGKVMKEAVSQTKGQADGKKLSDVVKQLLQSPC